MKVDFVVIGSGFGGSVCALRLAERGYSVAVVEKESLAGLLTRRDVYSTLHRAFAHIDAEAKEEGS